MMKKSQGFSIPTNNRPLTSNKKQQQSSLQ